MKRIFIIILITICGMTAMAQNRPDIAHQTNGGDRTVIKYNGLTLIYEYGMITVDGTSDYYDVIITTWPFSEDVREESVDGEYGVINMRDLPSGFYTIELTSSTGNSFKPWTFYHRQSIYNDIGKIGELINHISDLNTLSF